MLIITIGAVYERVLYIFGDCSKKWSAEISKRDSFPLFNPPI